MQRLQAFPFALRPNGQQERQMCRFAGACRFVYNTALALQKAKHEVRVNSISYVAMAQHLAAWRNVPDTPGLKEALVHPLQHALQDLDRADQNFFAQRAAFPQFKKKSGNQSLRYPDAKQCKIGEAHGRIFLPSLNRSILDQGWSQFRRQLEYKLQCSGGMLVAVPPQNTSRTGPCCGHVSKENRYMQAAPFTCVQCGYQNHADVVGAMNVLERGLRLLACGEDIGCVQPAKVKRATSAKREPTEAASTSTMLATGAVGIAVL